MSAADAKMLDDLERHIAIHERCERIHCNLFDSVRMTWAQLTRVIALARNGLAAEVTVSSVAPVRHREFAHTPRCTTGECHD